MGMRKLLTAALAVVALIGGCGDDDNPVEGGGVGLTEWLPKDAVTYTAVDIAAYKEELDLPEDADPTSEPELEQVAVGPFSYLLPKSSLRLQTAQSGKPLRFEAVLEAVDPTPVTAAATSGSTGSEGAGVAAFATTADEGEIGSRLGDLGYRDSGGVLVRSRGEPAIRLEEGLVFASDDPEALRDVPDEQRDDPPLKLLEELDGEDLAVTRVDGSCFAESGAATRADGTAELAVLVPGGAEAERMEPDLEAVGEPDADGELVVVPVEAAENAGARFLLNQYLPGYDCE